MSLWKKLFGKKQRRQSPPRNSASVQASNADDYWEKAIAAADAGQDSAALDSFQRAIELNPDYFISVIQPASSPAKACWKRAVNEYVQRKDAKAQNSGTQENHCVVCGKDLGTEWHYFFESLSLGATVGAQCPECNRTVCKDHIEFGPDGKYPPSPCPNCGAKILELQKGPAYSSMVEQARSERRYRSAIKEPGKLCRSVIRE